MNKQPESLNSIDPNWDVEVKPAVQLTTPTKKTQTKSAVKESSKGYQSDSSISWIWETVEDETENDYDEDEDEDSITYSPLAVAGPPRQSSTEWDLNFLSNTASDDEGMYNDPSTKSLRAAGRVNTNPKMRRASMSSVLSSCSSRVDVKERMNRSNSSLVSWEWKIVNEEEERKLMEESRRGMAATRGVKFSTVNHTYEYMTKNEYSEEEFSKCFYNSLETSLRLEARNRLIEKINSGKTKNKDTARGLEYWLQKSSAEIDRRVDSMIDRVMDEQDEQIDRGISDPMKLAELSLSVSTESMAVALKIAQRDAKLARMAYREMFQKEQQEMDQQTLKSNASTATTAMSSVMLPDSLLSPSARKKKLKEYRNSSDSGSLSGSNHSASSRRSKGSKSSKSKSKKGKSDKDEGETKDRRKMMKKRRSSKKLDKKQSQRSLGSKSASFKSKGKKSKKKDKSQYTEGLNDVEEDHDSEEDGRGKSPESASKKKRKSLDTGKKKRRSSASDLKVKENKKSDESKSSSKGKRRGSASDIKVKEKRRSSASDISINKDKRRSSAPPTIPKQNKRSSSSKQELEKHEEEGEVVPNRDPKKCASSLSSEEDEFLELTKDQSKGRRSFITTEAYKEMGTSWFKFLWDRGEFSSLTEPDFET